MKQKKPLGIQMGIACLLFGMVFGIADLIIYERGKVYPAILVLTPILILSGIIFLLMPGNEPPPEIPKNIRVKTWWKISPTINKVIWASAMLIGLAIGIWLMISFADFN